VVETILTVIDTSLIVKLVATAAVVMLAIFIAERAGPTIGAVVIALPISAGPAYVFLAIEHNDAFIASSALTSLAVNAMICPLLLIGAVLIPRLGLVIGLAAALVPWLAGAYVILAFGVSLAGALALNILVYGAGLVLVRPLLRQRAVRVGRRGFFDLVLRIVAIIFVVAAVIICGRLLGPEVAGIAAVLPIVWLSTAAVIHARLGPEACAAILANGILAMIGFVLALGALAVLAVPFGKTQALVVALGLSVAWNLGLSLARVGFSRRAVAGRS
jgi:hypothetical protein